MVCELLLYLLIEQQFIWDLCLSSSRLSLAIGRGFFFLETGYSYVTSQSVILLWFTMYATCDSKDFKKWTFKSRTLLLIVAGLLHMQAEGWCLYKMPFAHMLHSFSCVVCPWKGIIAEWGCRGWERPSGIFWQVPQTWQLNKRVHIVDTTVIEGQVSNLSLCLRNLYPQWDLDVWVDVAVSSQHQCCIFNIRHTSRSQNLWKGDWNRERVLSYIKSF